jgi:hypothetical protein
VPTTQTTDDLLAAVRERWPNALRTADPVITSGPWSGAVQVWTIPVLPTEDGYLLPNLGISDTPVCHKTLESAERTARWAFNHGTLFA